MTWVWFPVLLGWLAKSLILRCGGVKMHHQALPFFIGLVLGDYGISACWRCISSRPAIPATARSRFREENKTSD